MRTITDHKLNGLNDTLTITVLDEPGQGGACHEYEIKWIHEGTNRTRISFQNGPFACRENAIALTHLEEALMWLQKRTRDRLARGVEGTNQK